jgi:prolipoprotein diacylglyceryltransferase
MIFFRLGNFVNVPGMVYGTVLAKPVRLARDFCHSVWIAVVQLEQVLADMCRTCPWPCFLYGAAGLILFWLALKCRKRSPETAVERALAGALYTAMAVFYGFNQ